MNVSHIQSSGPASRPNLSRPSRGPRRPQTYSPDPVKRRKVAPGRHTFSNVLRHEKELKKANQDYDELYTAYSSAIIDPHFINAQKRADTDRADIEAMVHKFSRQLESKIINYQANMRDMDECLLNKQDWWCHVNVLSPTLPDKYLRQLDAHPPNNPEKYYNILKRDAWRVAESRPNDDPGHANALKYMERIVAEIDRLGRMKGGQKYALKLYFEFEQGVLPVLYQEVGGMHYRTAHNDAVDALYNILHSMRVLPSKLYIRGQRQDIPYIDAAAASRQIRKGMSGHPCERDCEYRRPCQRAYMRVPLMMLQRHAHIEVRLSVLRVVGKRLPRELADIVFDWTLLAEELPGDYYEVPVDPDAE